MTPLDPTFSQHGPRGPPNLLHAAVAAGSPAGTLAALARRSVDINQGTPAGDTPLMISASVGCSRVTKILLNKGAETSIANDDGCTALHLSAQLGRGPITRMLIEAGSPIDAMSAGGYSPLHLCAKKGHWEVMSVLIEAGANPNSRSDDGGTPLCDAAIEGRVEATRVLLRARADAMLARTDARGINSFVPLEMAAHNGHSGVVGELVQQLDIEECGGASGGVEALRLAALAQSLDVMEILSDAGVVDTGIVLIVAAGSGHLAIVEFLLQQQQQHHVEGRLKSGVSAYLNSTCGRYGAPPLLHACGFAGVCSPRIARLLVDAGADTSSSVRVTNKYGFVAFNGTPLAFVDMYLNCKKFGGGKNATEGQLHGLGAIRRLLMRVEAGQPPSWLWPSNGPRVACAAENPPRVTTHSAAMSSMLPNMRQRASRHHRVVMRAVLRYSEEPSSGSGGREDWWCPDRLCYSGAAGAALRRSSVDVAQWAWVQCAERGWLRIALCLGLWHIGVYFNAWDFLF